MGEGSQVKQIVARAGDGTPIAVRLWDAPGRPRVMLVHSLALDGGMWEGVAKALAGRAAVAAVDARGHGASARVPGPYTTSLFADDVAAAMDALGWDAATIGGCSMGGCVAQDFAARHAGRTQGLVLVDTTAWYGPDAPRAWAERAAIARDKGFAALAPFQADRWFAASFNAAHPDVLQRWLDVFAANDVECYAATCAMLGTADLRPLLPRIRARTAVLVGEQDAATPPAMARDLAAGIAAATLTVIPDAKHLSPIEKPEVIAAAIASVL
jgi:3-oxoadipate enol-lactonase